jgi:protein CpxP
MRKSILMGLGLAASLASLAVAQQPADSGRARHGDRGQAGPGKRGGPEGAFGRRGPGQELLKGISLTEAQKTQLKTLRESQRTAMESNREGAKQDFDAVRAARQKGDTATARALMTKMRTAMDQKRVQEIAAIRNILTADQRVAFDKNVAELKQREQDRAARVGDRGQRGKGFRGQKKGQGNQG